MSSATACPICGEKVEALEAQLSTEAASYQRALREEYGKREALDTRVAELESVGGSVATAWHSGADDMSPSIHHLSSVLGRAWNPVEERTCGQADKRIGASRKRGPGK